MCKIFDDWFVSHFTSYHKVPSRGGIYWSRFEAIKKKPKGQIMKEMWVKGNQRLSMHHPLEACYESDVDEPQLN